MPGTKQIRTKIKSVQNTRKITKAMEMVAASKMRKAQERMRAARPYGEKIRDIAANLATANPEYRHPFLSRSNQGIRGVGLIVVTSDKGLCGGLNTNVLRLALAKLKEWQSEQRGVQISPIGNKALSFFQRLKVTLASHVVGIGDIPHLEQLIGPVKVQLDAYLSGKIDVLYLVYTRFINTMKQEPVLEQLLPLPAAQLETSSSANDQIHHKNWDYLYEPNPALVLDALLTRYIEHLIYQAVAENIASEQSARMVAMKAASDNAATVIDELTLLYNKQRQAAITKELAEIVGGASAV